MTSQPEPNPGEGRTAVQFLRPLRDLAAYALVAAPAVFLLVAVIRLIPGGVGEQFGSRTQDSFDDFVNLPTIFFPLGAVLLALLIKPQHPKANLIVLAAAVEYAVGALFAVIFGILIGLVQIAGFSVRSAFEELLIRIAWLAVFALAGFATYQIWRNLFYTPKPKPQPGVYGQPQYGVPGAYPGQPGYGQPGYGQPGAAPQWGNAAGSGVPGQPAWGPPGAPGQQPAPGQPAPGQPGFGQPAYGQPAYGQPAAPPAWAQPASSYPEQPVSAQPASAQPASAQPGSPASAEPASAPPAAPPGPFAPAPGHPQQPATPATYGTPSPGQYGTPQPPADFSEPTQAVPRYQPQSDDQSQLAGDDRTQIVGDDRTQIVGDDRTQIVRNERPGFGPADEDPSRR